MDRKGLELTRKTLNVNQYADMAEIIRDLLRASGQDGDKFLLSNLLSRLSRHEVEILRVLTEFLERIVGEFYPFWQERVRSYREAYRLKKLFSFTSSVEIEEEVSRRAWQDTKRMINELSFLETHAVEGILSTRQRVVESLCLELIRLIDSGGIRRDMDLNALRGIRGMLEGLSNER